ncbi:hypothetical protein G6F56_009441 [Rhizopus delemar]|nr:hypothetical protein G6F56_009441 [Rhizopus delemar]
MGILSFNPNFHFTTIDTSATFTSTRFQLCKVEHPHQFYDPFYILNIYAPAHSNKERREFFDKLTIMLYAMHEHISFDRLIIAGDFNYSNFRLDKISYATFSDWRTLLDSCFQNSMEMNDMSVIPTFQRNHFSTLVSSVIDYIYVGLNLYHTLKDAQIIRLHHSWSDHSILHISFTVGLSPTGPGLWRANSVYASHSDLQNQLTDKIIKQMNRFEHSTLTPEEKWDEVKIITKEVIRNYSYKYVDWRTSTIRHLERKRNRILRGKPPMAVRTQLITPIDKALGRLQQELATIEGLKAGAKWREQGEKSAGFFKRLHQQRTTQQHMTAIKHLNVESSNVTIDSITNETHTSDPEAMREVVRQYYQELYTTNRVTEVDIENYLQTINFNRQVDSVDNDALIAPITLDDLLEQVKRSPNQSSPGQDGLGYQYLNVLFRIPALQPLILEVYNKALTSESTPSSWKEIRVRLLPKKGDLTNLKNWRPISLINCDAKIFTRVLNLRLSNIVKDIIEPSQTGFIRGRFIGDNGLLLHLLIQQAQFTKYSGLGLLLDQEKAYDRVSPQYLVLVLKSFGFHDQFVRCIHHLFFGNSFQINVNGFFFANRRSTTWLTSR